MILANIKSMRPLDQETDVNIVRSYARAVELRWLEAEKIISALRERLREENQTSLKITDHLSRMEKKFFGFGRETRLDRPRLARKHEQLRLHSGTLVYEESAQSQNQKSLNTAQVLNYFMSPEEFSEENVSREIQLKTPIQAWAEMKNFYQESSEITVTERTYQKVIHRQAKYRLKDEYNTTGKEVIITAPGPAKLKAGSRYSIDFALSVVSDKYEYHLPLERQRRKMEAAGFDVEVKTLYGLCETVAGHGEKVIEDIRQEMMQDFCALHIDESPWRILGAKETGQMWVLANRLGAIYRFEPTRSGKIATEFLKNYEGAIVTDGFAGYNALRKSEKIRVGHCWAHARREFFERRSDYLDECDRALDLIDLIFELEASAKTFDELRELRRTDLKFVVDQLYDWLIKTRPKFLPSEGISRAIDYCLKFWSELTLFLRDLSVPIDNNEAERALRHSVMGKKNFAGSKTINGADVAATLYTLIESAKKAGLQPKEYLKYLIIERWNNRVPLTPQKFAKERLSVKTKIAFPDLSDWKI
jgi:transposase